MFQKNSPLSLDTYPRPVGGGGGGGGGGECECECVVVPWVSLCKGRL